MLIAASPDSNIDNTRVKETGRDKKCFLLALSIKKGGLGIAWHSLPFIKVLSVYDGLDSSPSNQVYKEMMLCR